MPEPSVPNGSRLLRSRRQFIDLSGTDHNPLPWAEADLLFSLLTEAMGTLALDARATEGAQLEGVGKLWDTYGLARSFLVAPSLLGRRETARWLGNSTHLCLVPSGPPPEDTVALRDVQSWRVRLDLGLGEAALRDWIELAAAGSYHVELVLGTAPAELHGRLAARLSSLTSPLDAARVTYCVHGVPHCLVPRPERAFSALQDGHCLYEPDPAFQPTVDALIATPAGQRRRKLLELIRGTSRYQRTLGQKLFNVAVGRLRPNSPASRFAQRMAYDAGKLVACLHRGTPVDPGALLIAKPLASDGRHRAVCAACALRTACPGVSSFAAGLLDEAELMPAAGDAPADPLHLLRVHGQVIPSIDAPRFAGANPALVQHARAIVADVSRGREIKSSAYTIEGAPFNKMNGSIEWLPAWEKLCLSTALDRRKRPLTLSATFFGRARYVGFSFGSSLQVMCPAVAERHTLALHVDAQGNYQLLRDGEAVEPVHVPLQVNRAGRLPEQLEPRLAVYGIDRSLITQAVFLWDESPTAATKRGGGQEVAISVVVVCTKYSRRLALLARSLAGQVDFDLAKAELVVAYVPGLDGTEDILDGLAHVRPELGTVGVPFDAELMTHKGFMINQVVNHASGRRVLITDADIVMPPDVFRRLESEYGDRHFVAVEGRKMLDAKTTAELLMGRFDPVADFQRLRDEAPGERRIGEAKQTPIGYFQCVLRSHFNTVSYSERPHFEGADMQFSLDIRQAFGRETVMKDTLVLHLDHAGSRWYGTQRQF